MRVLSLSTVFPNAEEPALGIFVRSRLEHLAAILPCVVVAPVPLLDYARPLRRWYRRRLPVREEGRLEVRRPRWLYPPGGTPLTPFCLFLRLLPLLWRIRRWFPFDLIDAHFGYPEGVAAALLAMVFRVPFAVTLRGSEPVFAGSRWRRYCLRWTLRRAAAVIAVSEPLRRFAVSAGAAAERTRCIPNGIAGDFFENRDRNRARAGLALPPAAMVLVSAGELIEAKGHHLVIAAAARMVEEGRDLHVFIAGGVARGGRPFDRQLRALAQRLGMSERVHFTGLLDRERLADLMTAADVFCLASYTEGWPNVVHEALACGAPVVAANVGAIPEMIPGEAYGLVVPARDEAALCRALRRALERDWDRAAIAAWGRSRSWSDVAREVAACLSAARGTPRPAGRAGSYSENYVRD